MHRTIQPEPGRLLRPTTRLAKSRRDDGSTEVDPVTLAEPEPHRVQARVRRLAAPPDRRVSASRPRVVDDEDGIKRDGWFAFVVRRDAFGHLRLAPAWPLWALIVMFPVWWAVGLGYFIFPISAIPMGYSLWRRRPIQIPRGYWLWGLFLLWNVLGMVMLNRTPAGSHPGSVSGRTLAVGLSLIQFGSATVTLLFAANLSKRDLPQLRLARWMGVLFVVTVAGGLLGTLAPHFQFTSPLELLLPGHIRSNSYVTALVHPKAAQLQSVLGEPGGRASAPFAYTNFWANNLSLLMIWFIVGCNVNASRRRKVFGWVVIAISIYPIIYSLNRGLWIGLGVAIIWYLGRLFLQGRIAPLISVVALLVVGVLVFLFSPLSDVGKARLDHPESNDIRAFLTTQSIKGAIESPLLGWGGPRKTIGSSQSIAIGATPKCPGCGDFSIGSSGQLWAVLFDNGILGAIFFVGFFGYSLWIYRHDRTPVGQGGTMVVMLMFVYMLFYNSVPAALTFTMISIGMLWRSADPAAPPEPGVDSIDPPAIHEPATDHALTGHPQPA